MTNPNRVVMGGYATIEEARAAWANIVDNDNLAIVEINIGFSEMKPATKPVCWIILPNVALER